MEEDREALGDGGVGEEVGDIQRELVNRLRMSECTRVKHVGKYIFKGC